MRDIKYEEIGKRVRSIRRDCRRSMEQMANEAGISRYTLDFYEKGSRLPGLKLLLHLQDEYSANIAYILTGEGTPYQMSETDKNIISFIHARADLYELLSEMVKNPKLYHCLMVLYIKMFSKKK